jgi:hypothetical protein
LLCNGDQKTASAHYRQGAGSLAKAKTDGKTRRNKDLVHAMQHANGPAAKYSIKNPKKNVHKKTMYLFNK